MAVTAKDIPVSAHAPARNLSFIEWLTPTWGRTAGRWVTAHVSDSLSMTIACGLMALITVTIGLGLLFGDGYATIQGVRYVLRIAGLAQIRVDDFPPLPWWTIQVILVFIQVFAKKVAGLRFLWTPSYIFNATTTAVFIGLGVANTFGFSLGITPREVLVGTGICGGVGAVLGHFLAIGAEQVTLTGLCMLGGIFSGLFAK